MIDEVTRDWAILCGLPDPQQVIRPVIWRAEPTEFSTTPVRERGDIFKLDHREYILSRHESQWYSISVEPRPTTHFARSDHTHPWRKQETPQIELRQAIRRALSGGMTEDEIREVFAAEAIDIVHSS